MKRFFVSFFSLIFFMSQFNSAFAGKAIADRNCKEFVTIH